MAAPGSARTIDDVLDGRAVTPVFQPIVDLDDGHVVAYEALARGPLGSELEAPAALFAAAARAGLVQALDWECRAAAVRAAREAGLGRRAGLLVNVEPGTLGSPPPAHLQVDLDDGSRSLDLVLEVTERALATDPAALLEGIDRARDQGWAIAIDDVGAEPTSLALMPVIDPDVIKLDMRLVQGALDPGAAEVARAVMAQAERSGAVILAEGIETAEQVHRARALGARLGQGWHFGRPAPLPDHLPVAARRPSRPWRPARPIPPTPFAALDPTLPTAVATKHDLLAMSHAIEASALWSPSAPIVVSTFQAARHLTPATARRYARLARGRAFVGAIGAGMTAEPVAGVRGSHIPPGHPLEGEWVVAALGPHEAAALVARDLGDAGPDRSRRFAYAVTHRRSVVVDVVRATLAHVAAQPGT